MLLAGANSLSYISWCHAPSSLALPQVLDWIQNPVPASQYNPPCPTEEQLLARLPGGKLLCESNATISCGNVRPARAAQCQNGRVLWVLAFGGVCWSLTSYQPPTATLPADTRSLLLRRVCSTPTRARATARMRPHHSGMGSAGI